jgi:tyrosine-protein phosphatase SIW14
LADGGARPRILCLPMRRLPFFLVSALYLLTGLPRTQAQCTESTAHRQLAFATPQRVKGVPDFVEVTTHFLRGGQPSRTGFERLREMGVDVVVDLRGNRDSERREVNRLGMEYVTISWHCPFPHDATFARFLTLMRANARRKVFVHCRLGDDRVGMMVAAYRMAEQGWTAKQAMQEMRASGFTRAHHLLCPGLASYEKHFPQHYRSNPAFAALRRVRNSR